MPMTSVDYRSKLRADKTVSLPTVVGTRTDPQAEAAPAGTEAQGWRPPDLARVEEFLQLLARAVRQFHTYPSTSPFCVDAIAACHKAFVSLQGRGQLAFRVTPHELLVDDVGVVAGTVVEHELVRRLHRAHVGALAIDRAASPRDFSRFCSDLIRCHDAGATKINLAELLAENGVDKIVPHMTPRPEVLAIGAPPAPLRGLVEHERSCRQALVATGGTFNHMYPPDKGWVRLDPAAGYDTVSLADLAILVDDPAEFASMLLRLTDDEAAGSGARQTALEQKFSDVVTLFGSLDARLARLMFAKLARAVLDLQPEGRKELLRRTILPGLLDGRVDGAVLKDFPDLDLVESLCLLLDLETAAPEVLTAALNRLELPEERRMAVVPLLEARLRDGEPGGTASDARQKEGIDRYARKLIRIDLTGGKSFAEFAAFDLSIDPQTAATIAGIRDAIGATDLLVSRLECLLSLVRLEPNPSVVKTFLGRVMEPLAELERAARWQDLASWVARYGQLAAALQEPRPEVAEAIAKALGAFCTRDHAMQLIELYETDDQGRADASALLGGFGVTIAPVLVALLDDPTVQSKTRPLVQLMCDHAKLLGPALVAQADHCGIAATRAIVGVLGFAGAGFETAVAARLGDPDEQTVREALRALARIGTNRAAALVAAQIEHGSGWVRGVAEEALWRFPPTQANAQLRDMVGRRDFVLRNPQVAERLLDRAARTGTSGLEHALAALVPLRFRFWNPTLVRVALKARKILGQCRQSEPQVHRVSER